MSFVHLPSPTRLLLNITGGDVLFFFSLALVLTGRSRTPRRPRSPGSKSKEFTPGDASSVHSVHVCLGGTSVPFFSSPLGRPYHSATFLPSQHSQQRTESSVHQFYDLSLHLSPASFLAEPLSHASSSYDVGSLIPVGGKRVIKLL